MIRRIWRLIYSSIKIWSRARASRMAAALTYFTMLSLAPLLTMAVAIAGYFFDEQSAEAQIVEKVTLFTTPEIAETVGGLIRNASHPHAGIVAGALSFCILIFGASGVFSQLHDTFNEIWGVPIEKRTGIIASLQKRMIGVSMVLVVGLLLLVSVLLSTAISQIGGFAFSEISKISDYWSEDRMISWLYLVDRGLSFLALPLILAVIFWLVPATTIKWRDVWPAGMVTALLISGSRVLIAQYLKFSSTSEVYGAAGSLVVLLIWIYVLGLAIFYGAAFCRAWSETFGSRYAARLATTTNDHSNSKDES